MKRTISMLLISSLLFSRIGTIQVLADCSHASCNDYYTHSEYTGNYNESTHEVKTYYDRVCETCGETIDEVYNLEWEEHSMEDGKCENCDYEESCEHAVSQDIYTHSEYTGNYNESTHEVKTYYDRVCETCGETIDEVYNLEWEEHSMEDGKCENCDYEESCEHASSTTYYSKSEYTGSYNALTHEIKTYYNIVCDKCGETIDETYELEYEEHTYTNGKCNNCGHKLYEICTHENYDDVYTTSEYTGVYTAYNHSVEHHFNRTCTSCGQIIAYVTQTAWGEHKLSKDGECDCGYIDFSYREKVEEDESEEKQPSQPLEEEQPLKILSIKDFAVEVDKSGQYGKVKEDNSVVDTIVEGTKNGLAMFGGVLVGIVNGGIVQPTMAASNLIDYFINYKNPEQYEYNKAWRASLTKKAENFMISALPYEQYYYYNAGVAGGEIAEFCVGAVIAVRGLLGVISKVETIGDGVQMAKVILDNGDEAVVVVGKNADDIVVLTASNLDDVALAAQKSLENIDDVVRVADDLFDYQKLAKTIAESYADKLKPTQLIEELANCGEKVSMDKVVAVMKDTNGKLVWLEQGNADTAGLWHILDQHAKQFLDKGISVKDIPDFVTDVIKNGTIVKEIPDKGARIYKVIFGNGKEGLLNVVIGSNGFTVTAYPVT